MKLPQTKSFFGANRQVHLSLRRVPGQIVEWHQGAQLRGCGHVESGQRLDRELPAATGDRLLRR